MQREANPPPRPALGSPTSGLAGYPSQEVEVGIWKEEQASCNPLQSGKNWIRELLEDPALPGISS